MRLKPKIIGGAAAASLLTLSVLAQDTPNPNTGDAQSPRQRMVQGRGEQLKDTAKASDIIGMTVQNDQQEKLGKVSNLVVDVESGRIVQVIISSGGFLGMGETLSPVPPGALQHQGGQNNPSIGHQQREIRWSTQM